MPEDMEDAVLRKDWFLEFLTRLANSTGVEWPITLNVRGLVVTGLVVSAEKYFEAIAKTVTPPITADPETVKASEAFRSYLEGVAEESAEAFKKEEEEEVTIEYINLKDAQLLIGPDFVPTDNKVWWRGKLSAVDGYIIGTLSKGPIA